MEPTNKTGITWIRLIRLVRGITAKEVADELDISEGYYLRIETLQTHPNKEIEQKIEDFFGFEACELFRSFTEYDLAGRL